MPEASELGLREALRLAENGESWLGVAQAIRHALDGLARIRDAFDGYEAAAWESRDDAWENLRNAIDLARPTSDIPALQEERHGS